MYTLCGKEAFVLTSKERVYRAIQHEQTDRPPRFIWLGEKAAQKIAEKLAIPEKDVNIHIGNDVLQTWLSINGQMERKAEPGESFTDEWGITWKREGCYNTVVINPLCNLSAAEIAAHPFPDPLAPERYTGLKRLLAEYGDSHFIGADISGTIFEPAYHLRGMETLLADMMLESGEAEVLLDRVCDFSLAVAEECARLSVDWIWLGDDIGTQKGMIMSPGLWRRAIKPRMKKVIDCIKAIQPEMCIAYHSCGTVSPVIEDLIEIGVNVLNPIQESALDMDQNVIKCLYGSRLTMMCGLDTQQFLPNAAPEEAATATRKKIDTLHKGGGYIFAASHTIQPDIPINTILSMIQEADI